MGRSRPPLVCLKKYTFPYTGKMAEKALKKILCLGVDNKIYSVYIKGTKQIQCFVP